MDNELDYSKLANAIAEAIKGKSQGMGYDPAKIKDFEDAAEDFTDNIRRSNPGIKMFRNMLTGTGGSFVDVTSRIKDLNEALEHEEQLIKQNQADKTKQAELNQSLDRKDRLEKQRGATVQAALFTNTAILAQKVGGVIYSTEMDFAKTAAEFQKELFKSSDGSKLYTELQIKNIQKAAEATDKMGQIASELGEVFLALSFVSKKFRLIGLVIGGILEAIGFGTKLMKDGTDLAVIGLEALNIQLEGLKNGFKEINSAGITLAGGMDQLYHNAIEFGLMPEQFAKGLAAAKDDIKNLGMSTNTATQRIAGLGKALDKSGVTGALFKLGYSFEDQIGVLAGAMSQLEMAGKLRSATDEQIAEETRNYGKSLKLIEEITGKNAKEQLARARAAAAETAIYGKLNKDQQKAFINAMAGVPEQMRETVIKGFAAQLETGEIFFTDAKDALEAQMNPAIIDLIKTVSGIARSGADDMARAQVAVGSAMEHVYRGAEKFSRENGAISFAGLVGTNAALTGVTQRMTKNIEEGFTREDGRAKDIAKAVESSMHNLSNFDNAILESARKARDSAVTQAASADALAAHVRSAMGTISSPVAALGEAAKVSAGALTDFARRLGLISGDMKDTGSFWDDYGKDLLMAAGGAGLTFLGGVAAPFSGGTSLALSVAGGAMMSGALYNQVSRGLTNNAPAAGSKVALNFSNKRPGDTGNEDHFAQLTPDTKSRFMDMLADAGITNATVVSAYRSPAEQASLTTAETGGRPVAAPGASAHQRGTAIDVDQATYNVLMSNPKIKDLMAKYKFHDLSGDPGHLEFYKNGGYIPGGKRGIVGDGGMEMVEGPAHVTSVDNSMAVFKKMAENIEKLVLITKNDTRLDDILTELESQSRSNQKILTAVS